MRPQKIEDTEQLIKLTNVFRAKGYEGSSFNDFAASVGLKKASLYHRFPDGKQEIAATVLTHTTTWGEIHVEGILHNSTMPVKQRLEKVLENIDTLYAQGTKVCILRALFTETGIPSL